MPVDPGNLNSVLAQIEKAYGEGSVYFADKQPPVPRISFGSHTLDYATGGGVPIGRWCHFYGNFGSFKTHAALKAVASAQKMGMTCALYNVEKRFHAEWAKKLGVDTEKLVLIDGTEIEGVGTKMEALLDSVHVHVVDSIAASVSVDELSSKVEEWGRGLNARVWGKVIRRINNRFDQKENTIILINQVRSNMAYGGGEDPPGGKAINFASGLSLRFRKGVWLYKNNDGILVEDDKNASNTVSGKKEPAGYEINVKVEKNTVSKDMKTALLRVDSTTGAYDLTWELVRLGIFLNVFERSGSWYSYNGDKVQGEKGLRKWIESNDEIRNAIVEKTSE